MPGSKRLYQLIIKYDSHILSAYTSRNPISRTGKMKWLVKNTNFKKSNINLVFRSHKQKFATTDEKPNILIDDYVKLHKDHFPSQTVNKNLSENNMQEPHLIDDNFR